MNVSRNNQKGFTLIELMIVVVIIAILASIAFPSYQAQVRKSKRADAQANLSELAQQMERFYTENFSYTELKNGGGALVWGTDVGYTQSPPSGLAQYRITLDDRGAEQYTLTATPVAGTSQADDGRLTLQHDGTRGWDRDNSGSVDANEQCWADKC